MRKIRRDPKGITWEIRRTRSKLKEKGKDDDVCGKVKMALGVMTEATWLVWVPKPKPLRKESNCSHWAGEMGHWG